MHLELQNKEVHSHQQSLQTWERSYDYTFRGRNLYKRNLTHTIGRIAISFLVSTILLLANTYKEFTVVEMIGIELSEHSV